jgi:hypothetical protein
MLRNFSTVSNSFTVCGQLLPSCKKRIYTTCIFMKMQIQRTMKMTKRSDQHKNSVAKDIHQFVPNQQ